MNYYHVRNFWQIETINALKKKAGLLSQVQDYIKENKQIIFFGFSQVGKTEILLSVLNVKYEYRSSVAEILRAGQKTSFSSTSTAIMYHKSWKEDDKWGVKKQYLDENSDQSTEYFDDDKLVQKLQCIRKQIEAGDREFFIHKILLHIYIPKRYFDNVNQEALNVIDFPGIESSNAEESRYVLDLANRFVPLADKIVLVCSADRVTELEKISVPGFENLVWSYNTSKFMVVLSFAFTRQARACIDAYRNNPTSFTDALLDTCRKEALKYINLREGQNICIEPIEVGHSLIKLESIDLWKDEKLDTDFYESLRSAAKRQASRIRENLLKSEDSNPLEERVQCYYQVEKMFDDIIAEIQIKQERCEKELNRAESAKELAEKLRDERQDKLDEGKKEYGELCAHINKKKEELNSISFLKSKIEDYVFNTVDSVKKFNNSKKQQQLLVGLERNFFDKEKSKIINDEIYESGEISRTWNFKFSYATLNKVEEAFESSFWFFYKDRDEACAIVVQAVRNEFYEWLHKLQEDYDYDANKYLKSKEVECNRLEIQSTEAERSLQECSMYVEKKNKELQGYHNDIQEYINKKESKLLVLKNWHAEAEKHFHKQCHELKKMIADETNSVRRMEMFCLLCLVISDYERIIKGIDVYE